MRINNFFKLVIAISVSLGAGVIGSFFTAPAVQSDWYVELIKPDLSPPAWVFGPAWTLLFILMGVAVWLVWKRGFGKTRVKRALIFFDIQLVLNVLWSIIFFGLTSLTINGFNNIGIALIEIVFLWLAILATIIAFYKISKLAAWLLLPYILWVSFATYLNYAIWVLN